MRRLTKLLIFAVSPTFYKTKLKGLNFYLKLYERYMIGMFGAKKRKI